MILDVWEKCWNCDGTTKVECCCCGGYRDEDCIYCKNGYRLVDGRKHKSEWFKARGDELVRSLFPPKYEAFPYAGRMMFVEQMSKSIGAAFNPREKTCLVIGPGWSRMTLAEAVEIAKKNNAVALQAERYYPAWAKIYP